MESEGFPKNADGIKLEQATINMPAHHKPKKQSSGCSQMKSVSTFNPR